MKIIYFILISTLFITNLNGKKDFYYGFVDDDLSQISTDKKNEILDANSRLQAIKRYVAEGKLNRALKLIEVFKKSNKVKILTSKIILLNAEILYKLESKRRSVEADKILESAINSSAISQEDLTIG